MVLDYFAQDQAAVLDATRTVYEEMSSASPLSMIPMIRTILGGFLFEGDDVYKKVAVLSGGERNRLALAKMLLRPSNVLLLDEPTNHLDLDSKEVLLEALADYAGTLIFVSHDRYFVDRLAAKVIEVGEGEALLYPGGYEDFLDWKRRREAGEDDRSRRSPPARREEQDGVASKAAPPAPRRSPVPTPTAPEREGRQDRETQGEGQGEAAPSNGKRPSTGNPAGRPDGPSPAPVGHATRAPGARARAQEDAGRLAELEKRVSETEQAVKRAEEEMASPGFYDDREQAAARRREPTRS